MPLQFQTQQFPFRFGLAEGTDPHHVPPGTLVTAENCVWRQGGRLEKRYGITALAATGATQGRRLIPKQDRLGVATRDKGLLSYGASGWTSVQPSVQTPLMSGITASWQTVIDAVNGAQSWDMAVYGSLLCVSWVSGSDTMPYLGVSDASSFIALFNVNDMSPVAVSYNGTASGGNVYFSPTAASTVRVVGDGSSYAYIVTMSASPTNVSVMWINSTGNIASGPTVLRTDVAVASNGSLDAAMIGSKLVIAYYSNVATPTLKMYQYTPITWAQTATVTLAGEAVACLGVAISGDSTDKIYMLYSQNLSGAGTCDARYATFNASTLAQIAGPITVQTSAAGPALYRFSGLGSTWVSSNKVIFTYQFVSSDRQYFCQSKCYDLGLPATYSRTTTNCKWESRPIKVGSTWYALASSYCSESITTSVLLEVPSGSTGSISQPHRLAATIDSVIGGASDKATLSHGAVLSSSKALLLSPFFSANSYVGRARVGVRLVTLSNLDDRTNDWGRSVSYGSGQYISAGSAEWWDGAKVVEHGFAHGPTVIDITTSAAAGMVAGTYSYSAVYEYRDAAGVLHRSQPAKSRSLASLGTIVLTLAHTSVSHHIYDISTETSGTTAKSVSIAIYRTTVGGTSPLYRMTIDPAYNAVGNNPTIFTSTFTDNLPDAGIDPATSGGGLSPTTLSSRATLYTTGGIIESRQPPSMHTVIAHKGRLFGIDGSKRAIWYTKSYADDPTIAPEFNESLRFVFDDDLTGLASIDDKLIVFSRTRIWYLPGDGPAANGLLSDYPTPIGIQTDAGCINPRSISSTPTGVYYQSDRGIYLLSRGLEVTWIGRQVRNSLASYPEITSAVQCPQQNVVRFTCYNTARTASLVLVYDYSENQWATAKYYVDGVYGGPIADSCLWQGVWTVLSAGGVVYQEDSTTHLDAGAYYVPMTLETSWISSSGPLSFSSFRQMTLHGTSNTAHDLTISVGFDSDTSYPQVANFNSLSAVTAVGDEVAQITIGTRRKCQVIRFRISDATPTGGGAVGIGKGPSFDAFGVEVGIKTGFSTTPATKKA